MVAALLKISSGYGKGFRQQDGEREQQNDDQGEIRGTKRGGPGSVHQSHAEHRKNTNPHLY